MNTMTQSLLQELEMEMPSTRKTLERIPEKFDWSPHQKSMSLGRLAQHLSEIPDWAVKAISLDELDLSPQDGQGYKPQPATSRAQIMETFEKNLSGAKAALLGTNDEHLMKPWSLKMAGKTILTMPRIAVIRNFVLNH